MFYLFWNDFFHTISRNLILTKKLFFVRTVRWVRLWTAKTRTEENSLVHVFLPSSLPFILSFSPAITELSSIGRGIRILFVTWFPQTSLIKSNNWILVNEKWNNIFCIVQIVRKMDFELDYYSNGTKQWLNKLFPRLYTEWIFRNENGATPEQVIKIS